MGHMPSCQRTAIAETHWDRATEPSETLSTHIQALERLLDRIEDVLATEALSVNVVARVWVLQGRGVRLGVLSSGTHREEEGRGVSGARPIGHSHAERRNRTFWTTICNLVRITTSSRGISRCLMALPTSLSESPLEYCRAKRVSLGVELSDGMAQVNAEATTHNVGRVCRRASS